MVAYHFYFQPVFVMLTAVIDDFGNLLEISCMRSPDLWSDSPVEAAYTFEQSGEVH
ncbi:hypothetical protein PPGU19_011660 [Paraburkholderia sp. PGU19]|nr:hypothetical protein PPGU19_011660 [Paraburkholderia sp. PGU19]